MIEVKCVGGDCHGLTVKIDPSPTVYDVVDPRDRKRHDYYVLASDETGITLVPEATVQRFHG